LVNFTTINALINSVFAFISDSILIPERDYVTFRSYSFFTLYSLLSYSLQEQQIRLSSVTFVRPIP